CLNDYIKGLGGEELYQYAVQGLAKASPLSRLLDYNKLNLKSCQARLFEEISANKFNDTELLNLKKLVPLVIEQIQSLSELTQFQLAMQAQDVSTALGRFFHLVKYGSPETKVSDEAVDPAIDAILKSHLADVLELLRAIPYGDDQLSGLAFLRKAVREHIASIDGPDLKVSLCIEALNKVTMLGKFFHLNRKSWITTMGFASTSRSELSEIINILKQHMNLVWAYIQTPERTDDELASFVSLQPELLNHIRNLDGGTAKAMLSEALTAGTNLNKIFVIKRGEGLFAKNYLELVEQERQRRISPVKTEKTSKEADFGASVAEIVAAAVKAEDSETRTHGFSPEIL
ncbi:MAG TPA: hypothetical protein VD770_01095, partial [Coxiellaceae bacterium]|nr:hypothetical protein [Coxiellaceae bacterium]